VTEPDYASQIAALIARALRERWSFNQLLDTGAALLPSTVQDAFLAAVVQVAKDELRRTHLSARAPLATRVSRCNP
jgi:hypothetical protein